MLQGCGFPSPVHCREGKEIRMGASFVVASWCWWHNCGVSCTFLRTGGAPCPAGNCLEKQE